jgi:glycosyltransferase involved in cell wall biosynthesis
MKICFIDTAGVVYNGHTYLYQGLGGSESATCFMARELAKIGFDVTVFNNCKDVNVSPGAFDNVEYRELKDIPKEGCDWDVVISTRSVRPFASPLGLMETGNFPDYTNITDNAKLKILMLHDTFCEGDDILEYLVNTRRIDQIFTLSDWHTSYITTCNHKFKRNFEVLKNKIFQTRNGVDIIPEFVDIKAKNPYLFVFNSSVTKGMVPLVEKVWPRIKKLEPKAELIVIGGYYIFGGNKEPDEQEKVWRELVKNNSDIRFTGIINQSEISDILEEASFLLYPSAFPETFGISTLEAICHNVTPITCRNGALEETAIDSVSYKMNYTVEKNWSCPWLDEDQQIENFIALTEHAMLNRYLHQQKMYACNQVKSVCGWDTIALQWKQQFYRSLGMYMGVEEYREVNKINKRVSRVFGRTWINQVEKTEPKSTVQNRIVIISPVYNAENYISKCIESVAAQDYDDWIMYVIDDASTDNTVKVAQKTKESLGYVGENVVIIRRTERVGAVRNQIETIRNYCKANDIVILLDGDDWLVNDPGIFDKYNNIYIEDHAQMTYGSCFSVSDGMPLIAQEYPPKVKKEKQYKEHRFNWGMPYTHLRTFRGYLMLNHLNMNGDGNFKDVQGNWYTAGGDNAIFYTLIERADPSRIVCVPDIVSHYNDANPICDFKVNGEEQNKVAAAITEGKTVTKKILIAIPTAKYIEPDTFKSIFDLEIPEGYTVDYQHFYGYRVDQVRNLIAAWGIKSYDYVFFVDHDITFGSDTLKKLLSHDRDIVTGIYRQRTETPFIEIYDRDMVRLSLPMLFVVDSNPIQVGGCGFGCVLVKSEVLAAIGYPQFEYHVALDHNNTFSEDVDFCKKAMARNFTVWCDKTITCGHIGSKSFDVVVPSYINN